MQSADDIPQDLKERIDAYLAGELDEAGTAELERGLTGSEAARRYFVAYCRLETDLHAWARGRRAGARAVDSIPGAGAGSAEAAEAVGAAGGVGPPRRGRRRLVALALAAAAVIALAVAGIWLASGRPAAGAEVAWLSNAQNCEWAEGEGEAGRWAGGRTLKLRRGLAEIRLAGGASAVLEGPAELELLSANSVRLARGKLAARVPPAARGFQVLLPQGRVVDLGTEFGVSVGAAGDSDVTVFDGTVEAYPGPGAAKVAVVGSQAARISAGRVALRAAPAASGAGAFVRQIRPPPAIVPRTRRLDFAAAVPGTLADAAGAGTGLTHRLPGTGDRLPAADPNLALDPAGRALRLTTTRSDINTQWRLAEGEYLGFRLSDLGFTGAEDFEVSAVVANVPALAAVGQFGLYAGARGDRNIRGGLISRTEPGSYRQFLVNNDGGRDADAHFVGVVETGDNVRLTLRRQAGRYALVLQNLSGGGSSTLAVRHPEFLDRERDLYVGLFGANTGSEQRRTLTIDEFSATVWTVSPAPSGK